MEDSVTVVPSPDSPPVVVVEDDTDVVVVVSGDGPRGVQGAPAPVDHFTFSQGTAQAVWDIVHNLGKFPSVVVQDSANSEIEGDIEYVSSNEIKLTFSAAFSGVAYLN